MTVPEPADSDHEHFVTREPEMERLGAFLDQALRGKGQICFVSGDAGTGKSMLVAEFERAAQQRHKDLLLAVGICDPQAGNGLPYAAFREILAVLTNTAAARSIKGAVSKENNTRLKKGLGLVAETLFSFGPDLLGIFVPGATLVAKIGQHAAEQVGWLDPLRKFLKEKNAGRALLSTEGMKQDQIIEQYVNVIRALAEKAPLLLVLEDLHWADTISMDLLFRFSRRLDNSRVLIIGTYRQHELRKPQSEETPHLEKVLNEIKRYHGDVQLDLNRACAERGCQFIDALLDCEPNQLNKAFRERLYERTEGQPLFTVELLRVLRERGDLYKDNQGRWVSREALDWDSMPVRVEGVIASRIASLPADMRDSLSIASIEGEQFTAEVVAHVKTGDVRELVRQFSGDLQKVYQLVEGLEVKRISQQRLSRYRFANNLFYRYLHSYFDPVERSFMHESVGLALEALYGSHATDIAATLAHHFDLAELPDKARSYWRAAGEQAAAASAEAAALTFFTRALELTPANQPAERYQLLALRERISDLLGERAAQQADLHEMGRLCAALPTDPRRLAELHIRRAIHARRASDYQSVIREVQNAIQLIETNSDIGAAAFTLLVDGYLLWGRALSLLGDNEQALHPLERALAVSRAHRYPQGECGAQNLLGIVHWAAGNYAEANDHLNEALPIARATGDLRRECETLQNLGIVASDERRFTDAINYYQQAQQITQRTGDRAAETGLLANMGNLHHDMLEYEQARDYSARAAQMAADLNDRMLQTIALINLGEVERELGQYALAEADTARALELARAIGYRRGEAITLANRAHITLALRQADQSLRLGHEALELAREIGSRYAQDQATQIIGRALVESSCWTDAESHYSAALSEWQTNGDAALLIEGRVGLAAAALGRSNAELCVDEIVGQLMGSDGADASRHLPLWVFLQAARALLARQDSRASAMIRRAQAELASRASRIKDDDTRQSYLNAPEHRAIRELA